MIAAAHSAAAESSSNRDCAEWLAVLSAPDPRWIADRDRQNALLSAARAAHDRINVGETLKTQTRPMPALVPALTEPPPMTSAKREGIIMAVLALDRLPPERVSPLTSMRILGGNAWAVWRALARIAASGSWERLIHPTRARIAKDTGLTEVQVKKAMARLIALGWVAHIPRVWVPDYLGSQGQPIPGGHPVRHTWRLCAQTDADGWTTMPGATWERTRGAERKLGGARRGAGRPRAAEKEHAMNDALNSKGTVNVKQEDLLLTVGGVKTPPTDPPSRRGVGALSTQPETEPKRRSIWDQPLHPPGYWLGGHRETDPVVSGRLPDTADLQAAELGLSVIDATQHFFHSLGDQRMDDPTQAKRWFDTWCSTLRSRGILPYRPSVREIYLPAPLLLRGITSPIDRVRLLVRAYRSAVLYCWPGTSWQHPIWKMSDRQLKRYKHFDALRVVADQFEQHDVKPHAWALWRCGTWEDLVGAGDRLPPLRYVYPTRKADVEAARATGFQPENYPWRAEDVTEDLVRDEDADALKRSKAAPYKPEQPMDTVELGQALGRAEALAARDYSQAVAWAAEQPDDPRGIEAVDITLEQLETARRDVLDPDNSELGRAIQAKWDVYNNPPAPTEDDDDEEDECGNMKKGPYIPTDPAEIVRLLTMGVGAAEKAVCRAAVLVGQYPDNARYVADYVAAHAMLKQRRQDVLDPNNSELGLASTAKLAAKLAAKKAAKLAAQAVRRVKDPRTPVGRCIRVFEARGPGPYLDCQRRTMPAASRVLSCYESLMRGVAALWGGVQTGTDPHKVIEAVRILVDRYFPEREGGYDMMVQAATVATELELDRLRMVHARGGWVWP